MVARAAGRLIALNSYAAVRSAPHNAAYGAGKAALANLVESLEAELEGTGVHAFSVTPGFVWTEMTEAMAATPWFASLAERGDALPPQRVAALVTRIARGDADPLAGRFLHALDDLDGLLAQIAEIERDALYVSRLRRLRPGPGRSPATPGLALRSCGVSSRATRFRRPGRPSAPRWMPRERRGAR